MSYTVKIKMHPEAQDLFPAKAHHDDAAYDIRSRAEMVLPVGEPSLVPTGIFMELPIGMEAQIRPRSGLAAKFALTCLNTPGTIDAGFRGEVHVIMMNFGKTPYEIHRGDRVAQMVLNVLPEVDLVPADTLSDTQRGAGGFGSTGKK